MTFDNTLVESTVSAAVVMIGTFAACYVITFFVDLYDTSRGHKIEQAKATLKERLEAADLIQSLFLFPLMVVLACWGMSELFFEGTVQARWTGVTPRTYWFQVIYVTRMTLHMPLQCVTFAGNPKMLLQMTLHHVLSIACFSVSLFLGRLHFWAVFDGCCEITTVFLNLLFATKQFAPKDSYPTLTAISGFGLWLGFIFCRLLLFPTWLWMFHLDISEHTEQTWDTSTDLERYLYPSVTLLLLVLSVIWFVPITKGMMKALRRVKPQHSEAGPTLLRRPLCGIVGDGPGKV